MPIAATEGGLLEAMSFKLTCCKCWTTVPAHLLPALALTTLPYLSVHTTPSQVPAEESALEAEHQHALLAAQRAFDDIAIVSSAVLL